MFAALQYVLYSEYGILIEQEFTFYSIHRILYTEENANFVSAAWGT